MNVGRWIRDHEPVMCANCGKLMFRKDACFAQTLTLRNVLLCVKCFQHYFLNWK